jgi:protein-tyrosine phosphatase
VKILFVCLGNICRSPTAEAVARTIARRDGSSLSLAFDSAGTADYHIGDPPDARTQRAAQRRGYDLSELRARQVQGEDFERFDLLLAMDRSNLAALRALAPRARDERLHLFLEWAGETDLLEMPDPYYGGPEGFEQVLDLSERGARGLLRRLGS